MPGAGSEKTGRGRSTTVLLDRDGVVSVNRDGYVRSWRDFEFLPGTLDALALLRAGGFRVVVVTNQSAVNQGLTTAAALADCHWRMVKAVADAGGKIDGVLVCPHRPDEGCGCRKPEPGLLIQAARTFAFDLSDSVLVGDHVSDLEAADRARCHSILVLSGRTSPHDITDLPSNCIGVMPNLLSVAQHLTSVPEVVA